MNNREHPIDYVSFTNLIERSSLGTDGARDLRSRTTTGAALRATTSAERHFHRADSSRPWLGLEGTARHEACVDAAKSGVRGALDVLVAELTPLTWHIARGHGLNRESAEAVVQAVWLTLLRHIKDVQDSRAVVGWLITTTRREATRYRREHPDTWAEEPTTLSPLADRDSRLWHAFHQLPTRCQELLRLTVLAGRTEYAAVAEVLNIPQGEVGPTRGRCLARLRELYAESDPAAPVAQPTLFSALSTTLDDADPIPGHLIPHLTG